MAPIVFDHARYASGKIRVQLYVAPNTARVHLILTGPVLYVTPGGACTVNAVGRPVVVVTAYPIKCV